MISHRSAVFSIALSLSAAIGAQGTTPKPQPPAAKPGDAKAAAPAKKPANPIPPAPETASNPYEVALQLAHHEFAGFTYKLNGDAKKKQTDCTQFLAAVVAASLGMDHLDEAAMDALLIRKVDAAKLAQAVVDRSPEVMGVRHAVADVLAAGKAVEPKDLAPGDLVQYWHAKGDTWSGHSGVVAAVEKADESVAKFTLFGAHSSKKGIAMLEQILILSGKDKDPKQTTRLFAVRIDKDKFKPRKA